jgi:thioredoxin 1
MKKKIVILFILLSFTGLSFVQNQARNNVKKDDIKYKVTFVELGSVRCIPCQKIQAVMKSIKEKYGKQVKVVFYDVWTPEGKPFAAQYNIESIPTQAFLDIQGKEFFRHTGFFAEEKIVKILKMKGVN